MSGRPLLHDGMASQPLLSDGCRDGVAASSDKLIVYVVRGGEETSGSLGHPVDDEDDDCETKAGFLGTLFSCVCVMGGTGILGLPWALSQGGWAAGALILVIAMMANYTGKILVMSLYRGAPPGRRLSGYPAVGEAAFGKVGLVVVHVFQKAALVGVATLFLILAGHFMLEGVGGGGGGLAPQLAGVFVNSKKWWTNIWTMVSAGVVALPVVLVYTLGDITPVTALGALATLATVVSVVIVSAAVVPVLPNSTLPGLTPAFSNSSATGVTHKGIDIQGFPMAFTTITFSFAGHECFPSLEGSMARPRTFGRVLDWAYVALVVLYLVAALTGYAVFGNETDSPILSNFPQTGPYGAYE